MAKVTFDLTGKTALVTGASQGLGDRFARTLADHGASVALAARQTEKLEALRDDLRAGGAKACAVRLDVTDTTSIADAFAAAEAELGPIDVLVNNAGIAITKPFLKQTEEDYDQVLSTNLKGCFFCAQEAAKRMVERKEGSIINIASVLGIQPIGALSTYCASKAGLIQLTRAMGLELGKTGVRVNAIAPGYIETPMNSDFFQTEPGQALVKSLPQRRLGQIDDLDGALLLLASDASTYMTGSVLTVDGGFVIK